MSIIPLFHSNFNLINNEQNNPFVYLNPIQKEKTIKINGDDAIMTLLNKRKSRNAEFLYIELIRLNCYINTEFNPKQYKEKINKFIDSSSLIETSNQNKYYTFIDFCIKFKNTGNYFIIFNRFLFFFKIGNENLTKCWNEEIKLNKESVRVTLKSMRYDIRITLVNVKLNEDEEIN